MKARMFLLAGLVALTGQYANAQFPGVPAAAAAPTAAAVAAAPAPSTLWSFLGLSKAQLAECRRQCCAKPCGQFIAQAMIPLTAFSGGMIQQYCPLTPSLEELADPGAVGAAAKVKADEAGAKARRAAVRYLGTVDCHYWPEAEEALIGALRSDHNECVRYEAALALGNGCCCTKKTIEALRIASSCKDTDGNPTETSDRVRAAAIMALEHCLGCWVDPNPPKPPEKPREGPAPEAVPPPKAEIKDQAADDSKIEIKPGQITERPTGKAYYAKINQVPRDMIMAEAKKTVDKYNETHTARSVLSGQNSLVQIVERVGQPVGQESNAFSAESYSPRPQNVWDMLVRQVPTSGGSSNTTIISTVSPPAAKQVVVKAAEPMPLAIPATPMPALVKNDPMSEPRVEVKAMPKKMESQPGSVLPMPEPVRNLRPSEVIMSGPYGDQMVIKPKLNAPAKLPTGVTGEMSSTERKSMKPAVEAKDEVKKEEVKKEEVKKEEPKLPEAMPKVEATPMAKQALQAFSEANSASTREEAANSLTTMDMVSCPDLPAALIAVANGKDADTTRKSAIKALVRTECATPEVISALEKLTDDPSAGIRVEAAIGMARLKLKASKN